MSAESYEQYVTQTIPAAESRCPSLFPSCTQVQLMDMVYRKALRLSSGDVAAKGVGAIVNLQSNDVKKLEFLPVFVHSIWEAPMQVRCDGQ